jgi:hypothetical protein
METECSLEMFIPTYKIKRRRNSDKHNLKTYCLRQNLITKAGGQGDRGANAAVGTNKTRGTTSLLIPGMQSARNSLVSEVQA